MDRSYEVYRYYLALRLHFTTDTYDVIVQKGRVRASKQAFYKRKDLHSIRKIADQYSEKEVVDFLVANFTAGDRWGGMFDASAKDRYLEWKRRIESLSYIFENDVCKLVNWCAIKGVVFPDSLFAVTNQHPPLLKAYLRNDITIETLVILNKLYNFCNVLDEALKDDFIWPDISRIIKKYTPFLKIDREKYSGVLERACNG
jgi:hypothetical protein